MSNSISTAQQGKRHTDTTPHVPAPTARETQFKNATSDMLDEARNVVEGATGQGQMLNPMIYRMLGIEPQYSDNTADLQTSQSSLDAAQKQMDTAQETLSQLKSVPQGKRSPAQRKQLRQLKAQLPNLQTAFSKAQTAHGNLMTSPKTITGLSRLDPSQIPAESPFSSANPLNQAQATEATRLNQYLAGSAPGAGGDAAAVDPTLVHQYNAAESALRAKLEQRYGPDYENSSVGQMALQNFGRQKNEAYATWNQQQVEKYNSLAFSGQANLQSLLGGRIGLMQEPSTAQAQMGANLANTAQARTGQESLTNQMLLGRAGVTVNAINPVTAGAGASGLSSLLTTPYNAQGNTLGGNMASGLSNWMHGSDAAATSAYTGGGSTAGATAVGAEDVSAASGGMSAAEGASALA